MAPTTRTRAERLRQELREEIVDAAFAEFSQRGYHDTGIAHIAQRLGIGHGTFYRHFKNKRDILDHVVDRLMARIMQALAAENAPDAVDTLEDYVAQCRRIGDALNEIFAADPRVARMLLLEATSIDEALTERVLGLFDTAATLTAAYFAHGRELGYLRADLDDEGTAQAVVGVILANLIQGLKAPDDREAQRRTAEAGLRLMFDGIARR
ncbi:TetR/AcrR family transcriptional regulator [Patulibacter defluvii]|uniref:TetR/AcrR family transcriptional regulator n=1 Tax=Patulibacter defluvii TaxID=3095358 RepID=UPI002A75E098|nr:helix-turn-helix domain-containing protein [Patulibacter sp. DM4]